jgi:hypothetical protein
VDLSGPGLGLAKGSCEHGKEASGSMKIRTLFSI